MEKNEDSLFLSEDELFAKVDVGFNKSEEVLMNHLMLHINYRELLE